MKNTIKTILFAVVGITALNLNAQRVPKTDAPKGNGKPTTTNTNDKTGSTTTNGQNSGTAKPSGGNGGVKSPK